MRQRSTASALAAAAGLAIMAASEGATLAGVQVAGRWNTPICWTGFIVFADAIVYRRRGSSWLTSDRREFAGLALLSIPLWLVFEFYNLYLRNWYYVGLPESALARLLGYAWAFGTIWPAIFEAAELVAVLRRPPAAARTPRESGGSPRPTAALSVAAGAAMLAAPFLVSPAAVRYMAAPVWLGFVFLLDPINERLGAASLLADIRAGSTRRLSNLILAGFLCGGLWEFWNYWALAKWYYTVPIMERVKIFEMPLPGYFGFPPFALECFTMYVFVRALACRAAGTAESGAAGRTIGL
jgi:hypothetical protein